MSCVLRVSGERVDIDAFLKSRSNEPSRVWCKGEFKPLTRKPDGPKNLELDISFEVSNADFSDRKTQFIDASRWFSENESLVNSLASLAAVDDIAMDFGAKI